MVKAAIGPAVSIKMIKLLFFARIKERLGESEMTIDFVANQSLQTLTQGLIKKHGDEWQILLEPDTVFSCNQRVVDRDHIVADGDEVAYFPPVTGG